MAYSVLWCTYIDWMPTRPGTGNARQAHRGAAEESGAELLEFHVHGDGRVLIEKRAGLQHEALAGLERALEDVAIAVQDQQAGTAGGDEAIHVHALAAEKNVGQPFDAHE